MARGKDPRVFPDRPAGERAALSAFELSLRKGRTPDRSESRENLPTLAPRLQKVLTDLPAAPAPVPSAPLPKPVPLRRESFSFRPYALIGAFCFSFVTCSGVCASTYAAASKSVSFNLQGEPPPKPRVTIVEPRPLPQPIVAIEPAVEPKEELQELTDGNFDEFIENATLPVVVAFKVPGCNSCDETTYKLEAAARKYEGKVHVVSVNVSRSSGIVTKYEINSQHMVVGFKNGKEKYGTRKDLSDRSIQFVIDDLLE